MEPKTINICGRQIIVQPYGGGLRYHCPSCDVGKGIGSLRVARWTNGNPGKVRFCTNG